MDILLTLISIVGSVGLFLYGMTILSDGLQKSAGSKLKVFLQMMTSNRLMAVITGVLITVLIQSSSATTVMVVSFVNANLISLIQAIGVIMGANIGTTVTGWIVAILGFKMNITTLSLASIAIALPLMFSKGIKKREISEIFLGFGFLFLGLEFLQAAMPDISKYPQIPEFLSRFNNNSPLSLIACVIFGTLMTCIVQSSSATMAITITMAYQGWIGVWTASALCLGQNIGTTITAYIASLGTSTNAKRAAMAHILFNVGGSILAMIFFKPLMTLVNAMTPGDIFSMESDALRVTLPTFLAAFHTIFNVLNTLIFFPFTTKFASFIEKIVPKTTAYSDDSYHFTYIANSRMDTPELYLVAVRNEIDKMGQLTRDMFSTYATLPRKTGDITNEINLLKHKEEYADQMQEQLIAFCVKMLQDSQSPTNAVALNKLIRIIDETESITDSIYNLAKLSESRMKDNMKFSDTELDDIDSYNKLTMEFIQHITQSIGSSSSIEKMLDNQKLEDMMNERHQELADKVHDTISTGHADVKTELLLLEIIRNLEHIGDYCLNIAEASFTIEKHTPVLQRIQR